MLAGPGVVGKAGRAAAMAVAMLSLAAEPGVTGEAEEAPLAGAASGEDR